ncbi:MAG: RNA methyltransferase [Candidatus Micrarchaeaceae archaeon]
MNRITVAVMEPKYQQNLGYIARVSKNFGVEKLILINPRCNYKGKEAIKYSKHARDLLESANIVKSLKSIKHDMLIGTTGVWHKTNASYYNVYKISQVKKFLKNSGKDVTILLGRDDTGLSREELKQCDATIFIETSKNYPILNISHALAIILQAFASEGKEYSFMEKLYANQKDYKLISDLFTRLVKSNSKIRDKKSVILAFNHIIKRSNPTKKEINALAIALNNQKK